MALLHLAPAAVQKTCASLQVAVKKLPTAQVSSEALAQFKSKLQTLAFASSTCNRLCRLLGFIVLDGNLCLVMRLYQQSLQQLLATSEGKSGSCVACATASFAIIPSRAYNSRDIAIIAHMCHTLRNTAVLKPVCPCKWQ